MVTSERKRNQKGFTMRDICRYCLGTGRQTMWNGGTEYICPEWHGSGIGPVRHEPEPKEKAEKEKCNEQKEA